MLSGQALRNFALALLDDKYGINGEAWLSLVDMLDDDDQNDIVLAARGNDGRFYLPADVANQLRAITVNDRD
jgi:hypothetical protein